MLDANAKTCVLCEFAKAPDGAQGGDLLRYSLAADRGTALAGMGMYFQELPLLSQCAFDEVLTKSL